jgi:hypothetical protein
LHVGIIYPVPYSEWVSPVQVVPKKGGMTVVPNDKNELIPQRTTMDWRMCMDYKKPNKSYEERSFSATFHRQNVRKIHQSFFLLLFGWIFGLSPNTYQSRRSKQNHFYLSI